jgi:hypothetical protein
VDPALLDGSSVRVASYSAEVGETSFDAMRFDPATGLLEIEGLQLPDINLPLGQFVTFDATSISGYVDAQGEFSGPMMVVMRDEWGNVTPLQVELTTGVSTATFGNTQVSDSGSPFGKDGKGTLTALFSGPQSSAFSGQPMGVKLNVQASKKK